jgi:DNA-binding transcriptional regulator YdaS (Cro superfamily)
MKLHDWLTQNDKTATWLAEQTGLHVSYVCRLAGREGVAERTPSIETCAKISEATGGAVTATDFMPEPEPEPKRKRVRPNQREVSRDAA